MKSIKDKEILINDILTNLRKAMREIEMHERKYEKVFYGKLPAPSKQPLAYWEGLVSGYKSSIICLCQYIPELKG